MPSSDRAELTPQPYRHEVWRAVEAQHLVSTLKLVDTAEEQSILEDILEETKPRFPAGCAGYSYLIKTPFRYGALYPNGSRFRRAGYTAGVLYASEHVETAIAELAFYRILFFMESPATPWPDNPAEHSAFSMILAARGMIDLTEPPLDADAAKWTDPLDYGPCQALADNARASGADAIRYESVRDPRHRANLAILECGAIESREPTSVQSWRLHFGPAGVLADREFPRLRLAFDPADFRDPRLGGMVWHRPPHLK